MHNAGSKLHPVCRSTFIIADLILPTMAFKLRLANLDIWNEEFPSSPLREVLLKECIEYYQIRLLVNGMVCESGLQWRKRVRALVIILENCNCRPGDKWLINLIVC